MKKRMLALLLTLCLVLSLLPAQSVVAEGEQTTYTVTIEGNGSQFVLKQNGTAITGLVSKTTVSVPVGSSLGAEGYTVEEWDRDTQYFIAWNIAGTDLGDDAAMLNYVINSDLTFTAGWVGVGDGGSASNTIAFNADGGMFTVTIADESWDTNGYAYPVPVNEGMGNYAAISDPWRSGHTFVGWMMGVQDENGDFTPDDNTLMTTAAALDVHADGNRLITFMAQWTEDTTGGGDNGASEGMQSVDLGTFPVGVPTTVELPSGEDPSTGLSLPGTAVATFIPASTNVYTIYRSVPSNGVYTGQQIRIYLNSQAVDLHSSWYNPEYDMAGERWELIAGNEYRIEFQGHTTDEGGITYTLNETVMPDEIYFPFETYEGYAEMGGVDKVSFKPAHAYAPVTYTVEDTSVAELASWGEVVFKQVGQTKVHAACGEMSASANVVVKPYEILELDKELKVSTGVNNYWIICRFQPAETGDYTFDFSGMGNLTVVISDNNDFTEHWSMDEGEWYPNTVALEENVEYIVRINTDYTQMEVGANVTFAGNQSGNEVPLLNVYSYDAPFTVTTANDQWDTDGYGIDEAEPGKCIGDYGITISDPVFWVPGRTFLGWTANTYEHWTDEEGNPQEGDVQIPGTSIMTTSQMMAYPARDDGKEINFVAQWDGDDSDYYSDVGFETLDGILTMQHPDGDTDETTAPGQRCKEDGTKISQQIEWTIPNNPVHPEFQFEGWLEYNEEEGMILVSETVYTTAQVFDKTVPSYNVRFVAKWDGIPMDDYKIMFQGGKDEEEPDFEISEDGSVILDATTPDAAEGVSSVELPVAAMEEMLAEDVKQVMIEMDSAAVIIDAAALAAIAEQADGATITLSVEEVATNTLTQKQQAVLEQKDVALVLTALILSDGEPIGDFKGGSITVAVPFELPAGDNAEDYNVWYVANDGTMEKMDTSYADGMLLFITKHFSDYVVIKTTQTNEEDKDNSGIGESTPEPEDPTQPTEPKPTEPKPTEPKPTEPKPTEPKPTEPTKPTNPAVPDTADTADIMGLMTLMLVSGAMAMALWLSLRKRNAA